MIAAHLLGLPVEESVIRLVPAGAAAVAALWVVCGAGLDRLRGRRAREGGARDASR